MQSFYSILMFFAFVTIGCGNNSVIEHITSDSVNTITDSSKNNPNHIIDVADPTPEVDSLAEEKLTRLIQDMYYWYENQNFKAYGFDFILEDTVYVSLENEALLERLEELKQSNFFSQSFIDNYENLAYLLDQKLQKQELVYYVGYYPPFGNDADPWCNCQDILDNYWEYIEIENLNISQDSASFNWVLRNQPYFEDFKYEVGAIKINGEWRISYLQEFDYNSLFGEQEITH